MQTWKVKCSKGYPRFDTYKISGESLKEAVHECAREILLKEMPDSELLISIEGTDVKWSDGIFGGKGGAVAEITAKISNAYTKESPNYRERHKVYQAWIYADKDDTGYTITVKQLRELAQMTQKAFADYFHLSPRNIENWEYERTNAPGYLVELMEYKLRKEGIIK